MRIVVALGGNALLRRGEPMTADNQRANIRIATEQIAKIHPGNQLVIAHGNGPQVGLLSLQAAAYTSVSPYPLDVLGAETEGMIGYIIEQELGNLLDFEVPFATLLTQVEVDAKDPAFQNPSKPSARCTPRPKPKSWPPKKAGPSLRTATNSAAWWPAPNRSASSKSARSSGCWKRQHRDLRRRWRHSDPVRRRPQAQGVEAVIDKDLCSALLAEQLEADLLVIATDVNAAFIDYGKPTQKAIAQAHPDELERLGFAAGSMGPKCRQPASLPAILERSR
jgi:carbamate kinase